MLFIYGYFSYLYINHDFLFILFIYYMRKDRRRKRGDGVTRPPQSKNQRGPPPRNDDILASFFLHTNENFAFSTIFKIKWPKSEEKLKFGGRWI